jgi:hypothetical protein
MTESVSVKSRALSAILWGGLLAGTGDLGLAFGLYGFKLRILQTIAAGLVGRTVAYEGGAATVLLGLGLHYLIAGIWSALYWLAARRLALLTRQAIPAGLVFGLVIYFGMNLMVLPLSALQTPAWPPPFAWWPVTMHMLLVGLPIALVVRHHLR